MTPCVIAYFPGSGGNRLARYLLEKQWQHNQTSHSHTGPDLITEINYNDSDTRPYPTESMTLVQRPSYTIELTHCLDTALLLTHFPGRKIIKIKSHFVPSYNRCWQIWAQHLHEPEIIKKGPQWTMNMALEHHYQYYTHAGVDWWADQLYDINADDHEFTNFMRKTIAEYQHTEFAQYSHTWQKLKKRNLDFGY